MAAPYLTEPVSALDVPATVTAQDGRPLVSLIKAVCFVGEPHPALQAWAAGRSFRFIEPDWSLVPEQPD